MADAKKKSVDIKKAADKAVEDVKTGLKETAVKAEKEIKATAVKAETKIAEVASNAAKKTAAAKPIVKKAPAKKAVAKKAPAKKADPTVVKADYDSVFAAVKAAAKKAKFSSNFIATQITLCGSVESKPLYVKVEGKKAEVAPYEYNDANVRIDADIDTFVTVLNGKKCIYEAIDNDSIQVFGDAGKAILFIKAMF